MGIVNLRDYQLDLVRKIEEVWPLGHVLAYAPTGAGKTRVLAHLIKTHALEAQEPTLVLAHRSELVAQVSGTLAEQGILHRVIAPASTAAECVRRHVESTGRTWLRSTAPVGVASVDTVIRRDLGAWGRSVRRWIVDEAHHVLRCNKWGRALEALPEALGLGLTATPERSDGKGLGAEAEGVFQTLVEGPHTQWLIDHGYLCPVDIYSPATPIDLSSVRISSKTGDYSQPSLARAVEGSKITGDVIDCYRRWANGKRGVTFTASVPAAYELAEAFNQVGIDARALDAKTPAVQRAATLRQLRDGQLTMVVNAALFDEGLDIPGLEVVCDVGPTLSGGRYLQRLGRALRRAPNKERAIYIDCADNTRRYAVRHGWPTQRRTWSLEGRSKRSQKG